MPSVVSVTGVPVIVVDIGDYRFSRDRGVSRGRDLDGVLASVRPDSHVVAEEQPADGAVRRAVLVRQRLNRRTLLVLADDRRGRQVGTPDALTDRREHRAFLAQQPPGPVQRQPVLPSDIGDRHAGAPGFEHPAIPVDPVRACLVRRVGHSLSRRRKSVDGGGGLRESPPPPAPRPAGAHPVPRRVGGLPSRHSGCLDVQTEAFAALPASAIRVLGGRAAGFAGESYPDRTARRTNASEARRSAQPVGEEEQGIDPAFVVGVVTPPVRTAALASGYCRGHCAASPVQPVHQSASTNPVRSISLRSWRSG